MADSVSFSRALALKQGDLKLEQTGLPCPHNCQATQTKLLLQSCSAQITLPVRAKDRMRASGWTGTGHLPRWNVRERKGQLLAVSAGIISNQSQGFLNDLISGATGLEITANLNKWP